MERLAWIATIGLSVFLLGVLALFAWGNKKPAIGSDPELDAGISTPESDLPTQSAAPEVTPVESGASPSPGGQGSITGLVISGVGERVSDIPVQCRLVMGEVLGSDQRNHTSDSGIFQFVGLYFGEYGLIARRGDEIGIDATRIWPDWPQVTRHLVLWPGRPLAGIVTTSDGTGVAGAALTLDMRDDEETDGAVRALLAQTTDEAGRFKWDLLPPAAWQIGVTAEGYAPLLSDAYPAGSEDIVLVLGAGGQVRGTAIYQTDRSAATGITVTVEPEQEALESHTVTTDNDGAFVVDHVAPGRYAFGVTHPTLTLANGPVAVSLAEGAAEEVLLELGAGGVVTGRVLTTTNRSGVEGVKISASAGGPRIYSKATAQTDPDGAYVLAGLAPGPYTINLVDTGAFGPVEPSRLNVNVVVGAVVPDVDFLVSEGLSVGGRVLDRNGRTVAGAGVRAYASGGGGGSATTDNAGRFVIHGFAETDAITLEASTMDAKSGTVGPFGLTANAGLAGSNVRRRNPPKIEVRSRQSMMAIEIVLKGRMDGSIAGQVVDSQNRPVRTSISARGAEEQYWAYSTIDGAFVMPVATPATYEMEIAIPMDPKLHGPQYSRGSVSGGTIALASGQHRTGVRLVCPGPEGLSIRGKVTDAEGNPIPNCMVSVENGSGGGPSGRTGEYEIPGLEEGDYTISCWRNNYGREVRHGVEAGSTGVDFVLQSAPRIRGRVISAAGQRPITSFELSLGALAPGAYQAHEGMYQWYGDPEGRFEVNGSSSAHNVLFARAPGHAPAQVDIGSLEGGQSVDGVVVTMQPGGLAAEGTVRDSNGGAVEGASIYATRGTPGSVFGHGTPGAITDASGQFRIETLSFDTQQIEAVHPDYAVGWASIQPQAGQTVNVEIVLVAGGVIEGVVREGGAPVEGALVSVSPGRGQHAASDAEGRYQIRNLPPGLYSVRAQYYMPQLPVTPGDRGTVVAHEATVASGETVQVDFTLD